MTRGRPNKVQSAEFYQGYIEQQTLYIRELIKFYRRIPIIREEFTKEDQDFAWKNFSTASSFVNPIYVMSDEAYAQLPEL